MIGWPASKGLNWFLPAKIGFLMQFWLGNLANVAIRYKIGYNPAANLRYVEKWGITGY